MGRHFTPKGNSTCVSQSREDINSDRDLVARTREEERSRSNPEGLDAAKEIGAETDSGAQNSRHAEADAVTECTGLSAADPATGTQFNGISLSISLKNHLRYHFDSLTHLNFTFLCFLLVQGFSSQNPKYLLSRNSSQIVFY